MEMSEKYSVLRGKHGLPSYEDINHAFEIEALESGSFPLRDIRRHMIELLKLYLEVLEDLIHPNSTVSAFHECKFFDTDKSIVYDLYARLMTRLRESNVLDLELEDKLDAAFIKDLYKEWPVLKKDLLTILGRLQKCWTQEEVAEKTASYFG